MSFSAKSDAPSLMVFVCLALPCVKIFFPETIIFSIRSERRVFFGYLCLLVSFLNLIQLNPSWNCTVSLKLFDSTNVMAKCVQNLFHCQVLNVWLTNVYCVDHLVKPVWLSNPLGGRANIYIVKADNGVCLSIVRVWPAKLASTIEGALNGTPYIHMHPHIHSNDLLWNIIFQQRIKLLFFFIFYR